MEDGSSVDGSSNISKEARDNKQAIWIDEQKHVFKLKQHASIPLAYLGPLFHRDYNEFSIQIFPVTYQDVCESGISSVASLATSFHLHLDQQDNLLELCTTQDKAKSIMQKILSSKFQNSVVTVEVERHLPDWGETDNNGKPVYYPTRVNKATFKWNSACTVQHLKSTKLVDNTSSEKQESLFLQNLPQNISTLFLRMLFPLCLKCMVTQVSSSAKAAILQMQSSKTAVDHLNSITDFCVDDRTVQISAAGSCLQEPLQQTVLDEQDTTSEQEKPGSGSSEGPAGKWFGLSDAQSIPTQISSVKVFTQKKAGLPGSSNRSENPKPNSKLKSPSDIIRDKARRLKYEKKYKTLSLPTAPPFPSELRELQMPVQGCRFSSNNGTCSQNSQESNMTKRLTTRPANSQPAAICQSTNLNVAKNKKPPLPRCRLTWKHRPQDGHKQERQLSQGSGYHYLHATSANDRSQYFPSYHKRGRHRQPRVSMGYEVLRPSLHSTFELPGPLHSRNYEVLLPLASKDYNSSQTRDSRDCELLQPQDSRDYELPPSSDRGNYELLLPLDSWDYELSSPTDRKDYELPNLPPPPNSRDYELPPPPNSRGYDFSLSPDKRHYGLPLPPGIRNCELMLPPYSRNYDLSLPLDSRDYKSPSPPARRDYRLPQFSHSRDYELPQHPTARNNELERAPWDRGFEVEHTCWDQVHEMERELWISEYELEQTHRELEHSDRIREKDAWRHYYGY